ncbi:hypothetical protein [Fluviicola sp.]|uniref:hypothetical protein n=1 Tax=Fluviicola sp. TaxID=1917219 RepID=UPI0031E24AB4
MKILVNKKRYTQRVFFLVLSTLALGTGTVLILVLNDGLSIGRILLASFLGLLFSFAIVNAIFYISNRKLEIAFTYENGEFYDYSKPFSKARGIKVADMKSITNWSDRMGINQYILIKKNFGLGGNSTVHRLKGNHIYFSDYIVDPEELKQLIQLMQSEQTPEEINHDELAR